MTLWPEEFNSKNDRTDFRDQPTEAAREEAQVKVVIFSLSGELLAFYGQDVREILPLTEIAWVPGLPPFILGLINVRGDIESVTDIRHFLNLPGPDRQQGYIALTGTGSIRTGILVDDVLDVVDVPVSAVLPPLANLDPGIRPFAPGQLEYNSRVVTLLDCSSLLTKIVL